MSGTQDVKWLAKDEQRAWRTYLYATSRLQEALSQAIEQNPELKLSIPEYEILVRLSEAEGRRVRMSDLAGSVVNSRSRLTHTITRLEKRGLVERERCAEDGRGRFATLTKAGMRLLEQAAPIHVNSVRENFLDVVGRENFLEIGKLLSVLLTEEEQTALRNRF